MYVKCELRGEQKHTLVYLSDYTEYYGLLYRYNDVYVFEKGYKRTII